MSDRVHEACRCLRVFKLVICVSGGVCVGNMCRHTCTLLSSEFHGTYGCRENLGWPDGPAATAPTGKTVGESFLSSFFTPFHMFSLVFSLLFSSAFLLHSLVLFCILTFFKRHSSMTIGHMITFYSPPVLQRFG